MMIKETLFHVIIYQMLKLKILILNWWKKFFWFASKNEDETYEKIIEISNNNAYTTGNLLDFAYFKETL